MVCHLKASVGSSAPVKKRRVLSDPKGGADLDQIPVSVTFDVIVRTFFWFYGECNTGEIR